MPANISVDLYLWGYVPLPSGQNTGEIQNWVVTKTGVEGHLQPRTLVSVTPVWRDFPSIWRDLLLLPVVSIGQKIRGTLAQWVYLQSLSGVLCVANVTNPGSNCISQIDEASVRDMNVLMVTMRSAGSISQLPGQWWLWAASTKKTEYLEVHVTLHTRQYIFVFRLKTFLVEQYLYLISLFVFLDKKCANA